jgi:phosphatidylserine decarboxylase
MDNNLFILHKHAFKYVAYAFAAFILFSLLDLELFALVALLFFAVCVYVFRNPEKSIAVHEANAVLSPIDGKVVAIEELEDEEYAYKIVIESGYRDISILRAPLNAKVTELSTVRGARLSSASKLAPLLNEYATIEMQDNAKHRMKMTHRLTRSFAPLFIDISKDMELIKGRRYGVMISGETTLYLPASFKVNVERGSRVSASETLIGYFL